MRKTRQDYLDGVLSQHKRREHGEIEILFRPFRGWFLVGEPRWFGDDGDFVGRNWREAQKGIPRLLGNN